MSHTPQWEGPRPALDRKRVMKAIDCTATPLDSEPGTYLVESDSGSIRYVTISPHYNCECPDAVWRNTICKHIIAALLLSGDKEAAEIANEIRDPLYHVRQQAGQDGSP